MLNSAWEMTSACQNRTLYARPKVLLRQISVAILTFFVESQHEFFSPASFMNRVVLDWFGRDQLPSTEQISLRDRDHAAA